MHEQTAAHLQAIEARARRFYEHMVAAGYTFFTGVPCSLFGAIYPVLAEAEADYYPATREDLALGLAAGAVMAGRRPAVLMQNSGLGVAVNALLSLQQMYALPVLLVISWRGHGPDAPEHVEMGSVMLPMLEMLHIPYRMATAEDAFASDFHAHRSPIALIVRPSEMS